jgi:hypothetical protein
MDTLHGMLHVYNTGVQPDLIYIDAAHDFNSVLLDISFATHLFPGATLCGDDADWTEVIKAVETAGVKYNKTLIIEKDCPYNHAWILS